MSKKRLSQETSIQTELMFDDDVLSCCLYTKGITIRVPIVDMKKANDPNRILMIKFKYGISTPQEENELHENIKNLLYKVIHKNNIYMNFCDVYQEIWKKIIRSKHTWNELKGTRVSTWIVVVANSVINTLRQELIKYNSRYCLYNDLNAGKESDEENNEIGSSLALEYGALEEQVDNSFMKKIEFKENFQSFYRELNDNEKKVVDTMFQLSDAKSSKKYNDGKISILSLRRKLGMKQEDYDEIVSKMKEKYCRYFDA